MGWPLRFETGTDQRTNIWRKSESKPLDVPTVVLDEARKARCPKCSVGGIWPTNAPLIGGSRWFWLTPRKFRRRKLPSDAKVSVSNELLPDPEMPTTIDTFPMGKLTSISRRLFASAPTTSMFSSFFRAIGVRHEGEGRKFLVPESVGESP